MFLHNYKDYSDPELIQLLTKGDQLAFRTIYERYASSLYRYTHSRIRHKNEAEEIIQDLFLWLWHKRQSLAHVDALKPYLYSAVRHKIIGYIQHCAVREEYAKHYAQSMAVYDNSTEENINLSDFDQVLERSIARLPKNCRTVFRVSRGEHMPIPLIAERLHLSTGTVENYIAQALKHLREVWGDHYKSG